MITLLCRVRGESVKTLAAKITQMGVPCSAEKQGPGKGFVLDWGKDIYNKLEQQKIFKENNVPGLDFTKSPKEAADWLKEGHKVIERHFLLASRSEGIRVVEKADDLQEAKLYTKYFKHKREFRVSVYDGKVLLVTEKKRNPDAPNYNPLVCSDEGGWLWKIHGLDKIPEQVYNVAVSAVKALGYKHGGVDIGYNEYYDKVRVFEVNTAPWMGRTAVARYAAAIIADYQTWESEQKKLAAQASKLATKLEELVKEFPEPIQWKQALESIKPLINL